MGGFLRRIDLQLVIPVLVLIGISLTTLFSVNIAYFRNQLIFFILGTGIFLFFTNVDFSFLEELKRPIYLVSFAGLLVLLFLGFEARGAARWLDFFGLRLQFSEVFKPFLAVAMSSFLAKKEKTLTTVGVLSLFLLPIVFLIYKQPDLGSALMYLFSVLLTLLIIGYSWRYFAVLLGAVLLGAPLIFRFLHGYQQTRILTFLHLTNDPLGSSYNSIQAIIAIGSGMFLGKGLGQGTQSGLKFLPEQHTDFIFATLSESLGFIGAMVVIVAAGFLLYRLYHIAKESNNASEKICIIATFSLLFLQFFINIGMNIGLLPIVGVPLPFVSYGGSSLLSNAIFLGIASSIGASSKTTSALEIR
ncbi:MAG TPA: FtsW/RodA/SpoVE family cell cycle protein [Patescibacteria group bacterium]|nr:FtsW/RodA/SpoVE family cell cycle protein [Patescibacteria group bacterium]